MPAARDPVHRAHRWQAGERAVPRFDAAVGHVRASPTVGVSTAYYVRPAAVALVLLAVFALNRWEHRQETAHAWVQPVMVALIIAGVLGGGLLSWVLDQP
jgi:hypothetical protein